MHIPQIFTIFAPKLRCLLMLRYMKYIFSIISLITLLFCARYTYAQTNITEIELTLTNKEVQGSGRYANLVLTGKHNTYGTITIYLNEFNNTYKTYDIYYATIGKQEVTGKGT